MSAAFELKPGEDHLSVNRLEYFDSPDVGAAIEHAQETFRSKGYGFRPNGRFAVIGVGAANNAVTEVSGRPGRVEHLPLDTDESHAGVSGYTVDDLAVAVELRALVRREHFHPAASGSQRTELTLAATRIDWRAAADAVAARGVAADHDRVRVDDSFQGVSRKSSTVLSGSLFIALVRI